MTTVNGTNSNDYIEYIYKFDKNNKTEANNKPKNDLDKDAFLRLLTTQLANQDPLNPIEDREFIAQLAQFSSLEQMQNLNKTISVKSEEMLDSLDMMNINQIQANIEILKEITAMRKAMEAYMGKEPEIKDPENGEDGDNTIKD